MDDDEDNGKSYTQKVLEELEAAFHRPFRVLQELNYTVQHLDRVVRIPQRMSSLTGPMWIHWILSNPNPNTCYERFRMYPRAFMKLCCTLKHNGYLRYSHYVKITEQVATFCLVVAQAQSQRTVSDRLQRSTATISAYANRVCKALCRLGKMIISPCSTKIPHPYVARDVRFNPWFKVHKFYYVCICYYSNFNHYPISVLSRCAHMMARVTNHNDVHFRGKSSTPTQNVMCVTNFDLCFTFVYSGWEGNAHDTRIFTEIINDPTMNFPTPDEGTVSSTIVFLRLNSLLFRQWYTYNKWKTCNL
jgi:hypothetical protein